MFEFPLAARCQPKFHVWENKLRKDRPSWVFRIFTILRLNYRQFSIVIEHAVRCNLLCHCDNPGRMWRNAQSTLTRRSTVDSSFSSNFHGKYTCSLPKWNLQWNCARFFCWGRWKSRVIPNWMARVMGELKKTEIDLTGVKDLPGETGAHECDVWKAWRGS